MVEGRFKSRSFRRVKTRLPAGKLKTKYSRRKNAKAQCGACGVYLKGTPRATPSQLHNMSKSQKRPSRPFGGVLCSRCTRTTIVNRYRNLFSLSKK